MEQSYNGFYEAKSNGFNTGFKIIGGIIGLMVIVGAINALFFPKKASDKATETATATSTACAFFSEFSPYSFDEPKKTTSTETQNTLIFYGLDKEGRTCIRDGVHPWTQL